MKTIGTRVKMRREQLGLSQAELASRISALSKGRSKCSQQAIQQLESDATKSPRYLMGLSTVLRVPLLWLTDGQGLPDDHEIANAYQSISASNIEQPYNPSSNKEEGMSKHEGDLLAIFRSLSPEGRLSLLEKAKVISFDEGVPPQSFGQRRVK